MRENEPDAVLRSARRVAADVGWRRIAAVGMPQPPFGCCRSGNPCLGYMYMCLTSVDLLLQAQDAMLMALDTTEVMVLERADYEHILENGFDGELKVRRCRTPYRLVPYRVYAQHLQAGTCTLPIAASTVRNVVLLAYSMQVIQVLALRLTLCPKCAYSCSVAVPSPLPCRPRWR